MKTNVAISSIEVYHSRVADTKIAQEMRTLNAMRLGECYTGRQLADLTGMVPGTMSRVLGDLIKRGEVMRESERQICPVSGFSVFVHRKLPKQLELV